jgi:integrase
MQAAAVLFPFIHTLSLPKTPPRLPAILSQEQVQRMLDPTIILHRTQLMTLYNTTGMLREKVTRLKVADIDNRRIIIHIK